jgi:hypothetical protein
VIFGVKFRTDFRVDYEIRGDVHLGEEHDRGPYNLMLTESADVRLDLPFKSVEEVAMNIAKALNNLTAASLTKSHNHRARLEAV